MGIASGEHQKLILDCARKQWSRPCRHGGVCSVVDRAYTCQCVIGFTGDRCEVHPCHPNPCVHQRERSGMCERNATSTSGFTCKCSPEYEGKRCHKITNKCDADPCLNGATCIVKRKGLVNDFHCFCGPYLHGKVCEHKWISRIDYERLKTGIAQTYKNLAKFKSFMHLLFAGWKRRFSCIYQVFKERKTWHQAEKSCASFGGHLTSIHSREEEQFIVDHVVKQTSSYLWIGGSDEAVEGAWKWTDGSPVDFLQLGHQRTKWCLWWKLLGATEAPWSISQTSFVVEWLPVFPYNPPPWCFSLQSVLESLDDMTFSSTTVDNTFHVSLTVPFLFFSLFRFWDECSCAIWLEKPRWGNLRWKVEKTIMLVVVSVFRLRMTAEVYVTSLTTFRSRECALPQKEFGRWHCTVKSRKTSSNIYCEELMPGSTSVKGSFSSRGKQH